MAMMSGPCHVPPTQTDKDGRMPIRNGTVYCANHPSVEMVRNEGFNALTQVTREGKDVRFDSTSGVPVLVFFCDQCGLVEMYAAARTPLWT
jgi:hypothetical protein